ncbi:MAG: hypothetical protein ABIP74_00955 [Candidatus Saccharimonas sp.]
MNNETAKKPKSVWIIVLSVIAIVAGLIVLVPIGAIFILGMMFSNDHDADYRNINNEITRIEQTSHIAPTLIECRDVELTAECFVQYDHTELAELHTALTHSGYTIGSESSSSNGSSTYSYFGAVNDTRRFATSITYDNASQRTRVEFRVER